MKLIDVNPFNAGGFSCTNEEPEFIAEMLRSHCPPLKKIAGIASGGEVFFSVLLPIAEQVVLVDHSYKAVTTCFIKALLLKSVGARGLKSLFCERPYPELKDAIKTITPELPVELVPHLKLDEPYNVVISSYDMPALKKEWDLIPESSLDGSIAKLDDVVVIHGDLQDLSPYGPFDFMYVSNIMEHSGRNQKGSRMQDFHSLLAADGIVLNTGGVFYAQPTTDPKLWEKVHSIPKGPRTTWSYHLHRKLSPEQVSVDPTR